MLGKIFDEEGEFVEGATISLDETTFTGQLLVQESGSPRGWIKITGKKGFVLQNDRKGPLVELYKAKYVMLEGLVSI